MTCPVKDEDLLALADGELGRGDRERVASHLEACAACREKIDELGGLAKELVALSLPPAPKGLVDRTLAGAFTERRRARGAGLRLRRTLVYAGAAVLAVGVLMLAVDRFEARENGKSMVSVLVGDAKTQHERKVICDGLVRAFDTTEPLAMMRRRGFTATIYDARAAGDGDVYMLANFSFAGGACPDVRDEYGNLYVPIALDTWEGPKDLVWLTPLHPDEVMGPPRELTIAFAASDVADLREKRQPEALSFDFMAVEVRPPKRGLDPSAMLTRMMVNAGLDVGTQREFARQLRMLAPNGPDALRESF